MMTVDRVICNAIGKNRRAIEKLKKRIKNSMDFHESRGTENWPKWIDLGTELQSLEDKDKTLTARLKSHRNETRMETK